MNTEICVKLKTETVTVFINPLLARKKCVMVYTKISDVSCTVQKSSVILHCCLRPTSQTFLLKNMS